MIMSEEKSNLVKHAEYELKLVGYDEQDSDYNGMLYDDVMDLIKLFDKQGHSGCSANLVCNLFNKLSRFEPIAPLTGKDDEWNNEFDKNVFQNIRCSRVFKNEDGTGHDIYGKIVTFPDGNKEYRSVNFNFPYIPKTVYVNVDVNGNEIKEEN